MTDNEIIKALENEIRSAEYVDSEYCDGVDLTLIKSAVALINCQKLQLADERAKIEICAETISRQDKDIERLKRLNSELESRETTFAKSFYKKGIADFAEIIVTDYPEMEFYLNKLVSDLAGGE